MDTIVTKLQACQSWKDSKKLAVLAAYEDSATAVWLETFYQNLHQTLGKQCQLEKASWSFNELRWPKLKAIAADEAASADLVVLSLHPGERLARHVEQWVDLWFERKGPRSMPLLVLLEETDPGTTASLLGCLREICQRGNLELIAQSREDTTNLD